MLDSIISVRDEKSRGISVVWSLNAHLRLQVATKVRISGQKNRFYKYLNANFLVDHFVLLLKGTAIRFQLF